MILVDIGGYWWILVFNQSVGNRADIKLETPYMAALRLGVKYALRNIIREIFFGILVDIHSVILVDIGLQPVGLK